MRIFYSILLILISTQFVATVPGLTKQPAEHVGRVCAFGDFNADLNTDIVVSRGKNLIILLQDDKLLDVLEAGKFTNFTTWQVSETELKDDVECVVGDFNGDNELDVLVSLRISERLHNHTLWLSKNKAMSFVPIHVALLRQQAMAIDATRDGIHDILGFYPNGSLFCTRLDANGGISPAVSGCENEFKAAPEVFDIYDGMPHIFADINDAPHDLNSDLVFMTKDEDGSLKMQVWQQVKTGWRYMDWIPMLPKSQYPYIGAPVAADFDADGKMDLLVPVCREESCAHVTSLAMFGGKNKGWSNVAIDLQDLEIHSEKHSKVLFRVGDFSLDGYPDLIALMGNKQTSTKIPLSKVIENVECKNCEKNGTRKFEIKKYEFIQPQYMALGTPTMNTFFDLKEDGSLDVLVEYEFDNDVRFGFIYCPDKGDTTFLKVQVFTADTCSGKQCKQDDLGSSISWGGACASFAMSDGWGGSAQSIGCQVPATTFRTLQPPFMLFGLGRSTNFVDELTIGVPRYADKLAERQHTLKQIVPNSRLVILPPAPGHEHWLNRLYVTPSQLIAQSILVMVSVCVMLLSVITFLHWREKRQDRWERQQQSYRFHFDAM